MKSNICYSEIAVENPERAQKFYKELLGWEFKKMEGPMDYWTVAMPDCKKEECDIQPVGIGMMRKFPGHPGILNYMMVSSIEESTKQVENLGGKVFKTKQAVPTMGWFSICADTEGNSFALWQNHSSVA